MGVSEPPEMVQTQPLQAAGSQVEVAVTASSRTAAGQQTHQSAGRTHGALKARVPVDKDGLLSPFNHAQHSNLEKCALLHIFTKSDCFGLQLFN